MLEQTQKQIRSFRFGIFLLTLAVVMGSFLMSQIDVAHALPFRINRLSIGCRTNGSGLSYTGIEWTDYSPAVGTTAKNYLYRQSGSNWLVEDQDFESGYGTSGNIKAWSYGSTSSAWFTTSGYTTLNGSYYYLNSAYTKWCS